MKRFKKILLLEEVIKLIANNDAEIIDLDANMLVLYRDTNLYYQLDKQTKAFHYVYQVSRNKVYQHYNYVTILLCMLFFACGLVLGWLQ